MTPIAVPSTPPSFSPPWLRALWATLGEVPLAPITALSAVLGNCLLFAYYQHIGFTPDDLAGSFTLGIAVTVLVMTAFLAIGVTVLAPTLLLAWLGPQRAPWKQTAAAQAATICGVIAWVSLRMQLPTWQTAGWALGGTLAAVAAVAVAWRHACRWKALANAGLAGFGALLFGEPVVLLLQMLTNEGAADWMIAVAGLLCAALLIALNARFADADDNYKAKRAGLGVLVAGGVLLFCSLSFFRKGYLSVATARALGIRSKGVTELHVTPVACAAIVSAVSLDTPSGDVARFPGCQPVHNVVRADIPSRSGKTWLLDVRSVNGAAVDPASAYVAIAASDLVPVVPKPQRK